MHTLLQCARGKPVVRLVHVACANSGLVLTFPAPFQLRMFCSREICLRGGKKLPSAWTICERNTKYSYITCGKSVCVRVEYSIAEEKEDSLGWEANRSVIACRVLELL